MPVAIAEPPSAAAAQAPAPSVAVAAPGNLSVGALASITLLGLAAVVALTLALLNQQKLKSIEHELVRRQQDSQGQAVEARAMAKQAQELAQAAESKVSLLDARVAETALQRTQLEDLIQQLSRSRDENVLADLDAAVRVALQQSALTGGTEPLAAALRQAEERLARMNQPRVERVRRAVARDLERVRAAAVVDITSLTLRLDEVIRSADELPMVAQIERRLAAAPASKASVAAAPASAPSGLTGWWSDARQLTANASARVWHEVRSLVRVTQVSNPDAMLLAPEQAWFVRENLKLRVLNARLALLARQFDVAQGDLREVNATLDRYFDRSARRVVVTGELVRQVAAQSRALTLPRPEETLAALAAAQAGR